MADITSANVIAELDTGQCSLSGDGTVVAFQTQSPNLPQAQGGQSDVFFRNLVTGDVERVSVPTGGGTTNGGSDTASVSETGNFIVFDSIASNLVNGDTNGVKDVFLRDVANATTTRISVDANENQGNAVSDSGVIAREAPNLITFYSDATNLVSGDTNGARDIFVKNTQTGAVTRASVASDGTQANGASAIQTAGSWTIAISDDGRYVAFASDATNLVTNDTNGATDIFRHDLQTGATIRVSVSASGVQADQDCILPSISADGRFVTFVSTATTIASGGTNPGSLYHVYLKDLQAGTLRQLDLNTSGGQPVSGNARTPYISADGSRIVLPQTPPIWSPTTPTAFRISSAR